MISYYLAKEQLIGRGVQVFKNQLLTESEYSKYIKTGFESKEFSEEFRNNFEKREIHQGDIDKTSTGRFFIMRKKVEFVKDDALGKEDKILRARARAGGRELVVSYHHTYHQYVYSVYETKFNTLIGKDKILSCGEVLDAIQKELDVFNHDDVMTEHNLFICQMPTVKEIKTYFDWATRKEVPIMQSFLKIR